jgi:hypothetical protein
MGITMIDPGEFPETGVFNLIAIRSPADATGQVIFPGGEAQNHPKCKLIKCVVIPLAYSTAIDVIAIERGSGEDVATVSAAAVVGTPATATIAPAAATKNSFEVNEDICYNLTTDGNAANATIIICTMKNIH